MSVVCEIGMYVCFSLEGFLVICTYSYKGARKKPQVAATNRLARLNTKPTLCRIHPRWLCALPHKRHRSRIGTCLIAQNTWISCVWKWRVRGLPNSERAWITWPTTLVVGSPNSSPGPTLSISLPQHRAFGKELNYCSWSKNIATYSGREVSHNFGLICIVSWHKI